jgi:adenylate cyclase
MIPSQTADVWAALQPRLRRFLPPEEHDLLTPEPKPRALAQIAQQLDSLQHNLRSYLPRHIHTPAPLVEIPKGEWLRGATLFADVTGFTPLTEHLRQLGEEGAERLNATINRLFAALQAPLARSGGDLLIFAGDAILAYFPARPDAEDAIWGTRAALRMVRAIAPFAAEPIPLSMSVGVARGGFLAAQMGVAAKREYLTTGGPIQAAMIAESQADPGLVCLTPELGAQMREHFRLRPGPAGYQLVVDDLGPALDDYELSAPTTRRRRGHLLLLAEDRAEMIQTVAERLETVEALASFLPPNILELIVAHQKQRRVPGEHRLASVMFANLRGFEALLRDLPEEARPLLTRWLHEYVTGAWEIVAEAGGLIANADPYVKGITLLCPFGAPLTGEEMPQRAVAAALNLNAHLERLRASLVAQLRARFDLASARLPDPPLSHHIGITYGPIYTEYAGTQERREYVILGDEVNLSARLMGQARAQQILITSEVYRRVAQAFRCKALAPMRLKGKAKPVPTYAVQGQRHTHLWLQHAAAHPIVEREAALAALSAALDRLAAGAGGCISVTGETGIGKTRLVAEIVRRAVQQKSYLALAGRCLSYAQAQPYTPWRDALWAWFGLDQDSNGTASLDQQRACITQTLADHDLAALTAPLTSILLPAASTPSWPPPASSQKPQVPRGNLYAVLQQRVARADASASAATEGADLRATLSRRLQQPATRAESNGGTLWEQLRQSLDPGQAAVTLLTELAAETPVLFVVEDLQWADPASRRALRQLEAATAAHPILLLATARTGDQGEEEEVQLPGDLNFLEGLTRAGVEALSAQLLPAAPAPALATWLHERTQGNPLFITELLRALQESDGLALDPATGRQVLRSADATLPPTVREIVLSRVDRLPEQTRTVCKLAAVIGERVPGALLTALSRLDTATLLEHLATLAQHDLISPPPVATEYTFAHPLLREAIYAGLPYAQRRRQHREIAEVLVKQSPPPLDDLAYHYAHSNAPLLAVRYNRLAGIAAYARSAWEAATTYYRGALAVEIDAEKHAADLAAWREERARTHEAWGDLCVAQGDYEAALTHYQAAAPDAPDAANLTAKIGLLTPAITDLETAAAAERLRTAWETLPASSPMRAWIAAARGWLAHQAGDDAEARAWWQRGQEEAQTSGARQALQALLDGDIPADYTTLLTASQAAAKATLAQS